VHEIAARQHPQRLALQRGRADEQRFRGCNLAIYPEDTNQRSPFNGGGSQRGLHLRLGCRSGKAERADHNNRQQHQPARDPKNTAAARRRGRQYDRRRRGTKWSGRCDQSFAFD